MTDEAPAPLSRWQTDGIPSMDRPGPAGRLLAGLMRFAEQLNRRFAVLGNPAVYDNGVFPWAPAIEREWETIREELERVLLRQGELPNVQDITRAAASINRDLGWKIFLLEAYGIRSQPSIALCPETWRTVQGIPGLTTAMFSVLEPGKRLPLHRGPYNGVLRLHLGLVVPEPANRAAITVAGYTRHWEEGRVLIFDDAYEHEAWNETDQPRVVLFVDFEKPLRLPARWLNRLLLRLAPLTPYLREGAENLHAWERRFYGGDSFGTAPSVTQAGKSRGSSKES